MERLKIAGPDDLRQMTKLSTPVWIFDVDQHCIWWANNQGLAFWKASSVQELERRDFGTDSSAVKDRLRQLFEGTPSDAQVTDTWTLYPGDVPQTVILSFQPVEIGGGRSGVLIELVQLLERDADDETWRLLEATRATSLIIATFSLEGQLLAQNPASLSCYGPKGGRGYGDTDLARRFINTDDMEAVLRGAKSNKLSRIEATVSTLVGQRTHAISVRRGRDPVSADFVVLLSEEDITERAQLRRVREEERAKLRHEVTESTHKLKVSQERYELAVQTAVIWDWDIANEELFLSPNFVRTLGYEQREFDKLVLEDRVKMLVFSDDEEIYERMVRQQLKQPEIPVSEEFRVLSKSGEVVWYHCQGKCVVDGNGWVTRSAGILTDITHRKKLEASLLVANRMEAIGQLTGGIAHDFNNLLTVIQGNAELLAETTEADQELTGEIVRAVERGADLTRHLLAFARQQTLLPKSVDLNHLVPEMRSTLLRAINETVRVDYQGDDSLWPIHADPTQLETALLNLALNARDAMPSGGTLTITCRNRALRDIPKVEKLELEGSDYVEISVADTGTGMSEETARKAFEPFYTTKGVGQGSGLGLSMVQGFSRQSKGDARISSNADGGTTVTLYLPRAGHEAVSKVPVQRPEVVKGNDEQVHVLEDNEQVQHTVSKMVQSLGYRVTTSSDVAEALDWAHSNPDTHLYLVDILLPGGKSGVDFARKLRESQPDAKVLFMSGYTNDQVLDDGDTGAVPPFLAKPFDKGAFSKAIGSALSGEADV